MSDTREVLKKINKSKEVLYKVEDLLSMKKPSKIKGLYWLYTSYSLEDLKKCQGNNGNTAIPIKDLATLHDNLKNIATKTIKENNKEYLLVYSGRNKSIIQRVKEHFKKDSKGTGCLAIMGTNLDELDNWRVSYYQLDSYETQSEDLERIWRLEYGWPLLCRR